MHFKWNIYPNLAPFEAGGHVLLLPAASFPEIPHFPQLFTPNLVDDLFEICANSANLIVFFNSRHAGATQDHFHLQAVAHVAPLPIEGAELVPLAEGVQSMGAPYPVNALVYTIEKKQICCEHILALQTQQVPFNLIYLSGCVFVIPRDAATEIVSEFPNVLASMEIAGKFIIPEKEAFEKTTEARIRLGLAKISIALDDLKLSWPP